MEDKFDKLTKVFNGIQANRLKWRSGKMRLITERLEQIDRFTDMHLFIEINDSIINHETIILGLGKHPSGLSYNPNHISNITTENKGLLVIERGYLAFSFTFNGKLIVWVSYPKIEKIVESKTPHKDLITVSVDQITVELIDEMVALFIDEICNWYLNENIEKSQIGLNYAYPHFSPAKA